MTSDPKSSPEDREDAVPPAGASEAPDEGHVSFVRRLHERYGKVVDPQIHLQRDDDRSVDAVPGEGEPSGTESGSGSGSSRDLLEKLSSQTPNALRYEVRHEIARGGMGAVMRVWDGDLRRNLAMKVMIARRSRDGSSVDDEQLSRFLEEAQITGQLDHPGIVPVHDLGIDDDGRCYFTMRLVRGRELKEVLDLAREGKEGWTITRALALILKVCEAMAFAHSKGVVHRDLKPANVMVGRFGETYVMDWGLARVLGRRDTHDLRLKPAEDPSAMSLVRTVRKEESLSNPESPLVTMDGDVVGTPSFMSPEQARGMLDEVGPRSDVYSLGAIFYYFFTGRAPYVEPGERISAHTVLSRALEGPPTPVAKLASDVPAELLAVCEKAMARDQDRRYASMLEVADDIQAYLEGRVVRAYEGGSIAEFRKWVTRNRGMALALAGLVVMTIASAVGFAFQQASQLERIEDEQELTKAAQEEAVKNLDKARASELEAQENLQLAIERESEAAENAVIALRNEQLATRSGYLANIIAADYSLQLNEVAEARMRLRDSNESLRGWEWDHLYLKSHPALRTFTPDKSSIDVVRFSNDGQRIFTLSVPGRFRVLDVMTGDSLPPRNIVDFSFTSFAPITRKRSMDIHPRELSAAIAGTGSSNSVKIYDLASGKVVQELASRKDDSKADSSPTAGHRATVSCVAYSPDGTALATADAEGTILVWNPDDRSVAQCLIGHNGRISALAWSPDGRFLATASEDTTVRVWSVSREGPFEERHHLRGHQGPVFSIAWSPEGERLASGGEDRTIHLWDMQSGVLVKSLVGHDGSVTALDFDSTGERLLSGSEDTTIRIWNPAAGSHEELFAHTGGVLDLAFSPDDTAFVSSASDFEVKIWDSGGNPAVTEVPAESRGPSAFGPDGKTIAVVLAEDDIAIRDADTLEVLHVLRGHEGYIGALAYSPDGRYLLSGSGDRTARLWDLTTGQELQSFGPHEKRVAVVAFAPDQSWIATGSGGGWLRGYDTKTGALLGEIEAYRGWVSSMAVSPDGRFIATGGTEREITIWRPWDPEPALVLDGHERRGIRALAFMPDGERLISGGSSDHTARIWDLGSGECETILRGHEGTVTGLACNGDGSRIATGSVDRTLRLWDAVSGGSLLTLRGFEEEVTSIAFSPDDRRILCGMRSPLESGAVRIFEAGDVERRRAARLAYLSRKDTAEALVDRLFARHFFLQDVVLNLRATPELDDELRATCIRAARARGDDPKRLDERTRVELADPGLAPELRALALRRALAAVSLERESPLLQATLGAAYYRTGDIASAVEKLQAARKNTGAEAAGLQAGSLRFGREHECELELFLAMACQASANPIDATTHLANAEVALGRLANSAAEDRPRRLLTEARRVLGLDDASSN